MLHRIAAAFTARLQELASPLKRDAGEGPVPYIVIVTIIAIGAAGVAALVITFARDFFVNTTAIDPTLNTDTSTMSGTMPMLAMNQWAIRMAP